jgi:hypothetical protein
VTARGPRVGRYLIYGLLDPRDLALRYVGKTHLRKELRLARHVAATIEGRSTPVCQWIRELDAAGLRPHIFLLRRVPPEEDWRRAERQAIDVWRSWTAPQQPGPFHQPSDPRGSRMALA